MITTTQTESLHRHYVSLTGMEIKFNMHWHYHYEHWLAAGFTLPDLTLVVLYLKRRIRDRKWPVECLKLSNLVGFTDKFSEHLAIAKAEQRSFRPQTERQKILKASGRAVKQDGDTTKSTADILSKKSVAQLVKEFKEAAL